MKKNIVFFSVLICLLFSGCAKEKTLPESVNSITDEIEKGESLPESVNSITSESEKGESLPESVNSITDEIEKGKSLPESTDPIMDYDNGQALRVEEGESYTETDMTLKVVDNNVFFNASTFDGRKDLGVLTTAKSSKSTLTIALSVASGTVELVTVVGNDVTTIAECGKETKSISETVEIVLDPNQNYYVIQLVGDNCRDIELTMGITQNA